MLRIVLAALLIVCLALSGCQEEEVIPTPLLEVQEQATEGGAVVFRAVIDAPGWLVLHPVTPAGEPDVSSELARAYLPELGKYDRIAMQGIGAVVGDTEVFARLHYDDPADGEFTFASGGIEDPVVMAEGNALAVSLTVRGVTPHVEVEDTGGGEGTVIIRVAIDGPGWLVIRPPTLAGEPDTGTVLASAHLVAAGVYPGFEVTLPAEVRRSYFAVLHYDDPADGEFTFASGGVEDPPVRVRGTAVEGVFTVGD